MLMSGVVNDECQNREDSRSRVLIPTARLGNYQQEIKQALADEFR
jgi:hypothetical protein